MSMYDWARQEVQLAKAELKRNKNDETQYMIAYYDLALKAYEKLINGDYNEMNSAEEILDKAVEKAASNLSLENIKNFLSR